jgi:hypothetical protein
LQAELVMGRKKKGKRLQQQAQASDPQCFNERVIEELEALKAIFEQLYSLLDDGMGCCIRCI